MKPITVLIVDDSALIRKIFAEVLSSAPGIEVVGVAVDAQDARQKIKQLNPDVLTLDIEMPGMDGLSFLEKIMTLRPMPVIMVSTLTQKGAGETIRALEIGAVDYLGKPVHSQTRDTLMVLREDLVEKVRMAAQANVIHRSTATAQEDSNVISYSPYSGVEQRMIAIGSSTGGVEALRDIFLTLPANCPPIVMTQHMPASFTGSFTKRLDGLSQLTVAEAHNGAKLLPGHAWLAPGGKQLTVVKRPTGLVCKVEEGPLVSGHCPSVDVLFESAAIAAGSKAVGVILTGMGKDGAEGLLKMRKAGAYTIGQSQSSCVVYGMPRVAMEVGAVQKQLPLLDISADMLAYCASAAKTGVA
jgi:two-component system chemotaxis response regulator CheB